MYLSIGWTRPQPASGQPARHSDGTPRREREPAPLIRLVQYWLTRAHRQPSPGRRRVVHPQVRMHVIHRRKPRAANETVMKKGSRPVCGGSDPLSAGKKSYHRRPSKPSAKNSVKLLANFLVYQGGTEDLHAQGQARGMAG